MSDSHLKNDAYWQEKLSVEEFRVCRQKGTERAFSGEYWDTKTSGEYLCRCCGEALFSSAAKYDSGSGWPSFYAPAGADKIKEAADNGLYARRTEILCQRCGAHLGHVFPDGPAPTGLRYCVNSLSLRLNPADEKAQD